MSRRPVNGETMRTILTALLATGLAAGTVSAWAADNGKSPSTTDGGASSSGEAKRENYLGVFTVPVPPALSAQLSEVLKPGQGLLVNRVLPGSPAEKAALKQYDVLLTYDEQALTSTNQLKKLVVKDTAGRTVKLGIVRTVKRIAIDVALGRREVVPVSSRSGRLLLRRTVPLFSPRRGAIGKREAKATDARGKSSSAPRDTSSKRQYRSLSLAVTASDDKRYKVRADYADVDGESHQRQFEGTLDEIHGKLEDLPQGVRDSIRRCLDRIGASKQRGRALQFRLQPRIDGDDRILRIFMSRPAENGGTRILQLDVRVEGDEGIAVGDLLDIDELTAELKQLEPAVRRKVEASLRQVRVPVVRLDVQKSQ